MCFLFQAPAFWGNLLFPGPTLLVGFFNVYFLSERERERETEYEWGRGREREGDAESEAGSRLQAVSPEPDAGLELTGREILT